MDIITVVFQEELDILKKQAQSIELYCKNLDIDSIIVIVNDSDLDLTAIDFDWYGSLSEKVKLVQRNTWSIDYSSNGWVTQQALKLIACTLAVGEHSIILDAKTLFVRPVASADFFDSTGKSRMGQLNIYPVFEPSKQIVENLFDIKLNQQLGPGGVPFVVDNSQVVYMIRWIEATTGENFLSWFQDQGRLTEFILYSGWIVRVNGSLDSVALNHNSFGEICNVCHSEVDLFEQKFIQMNKSTTVSIHRNAWNKLTPVQQQQYHDFLLERGIT
jgi:hypothetical protein